MGVRILNIPSTQQRAIQRALAMSSQREKLLGRTIGSVGDTLMDIDRSSSLFDLLRSSPVIAVSGSADGSHDDTSGDVLEHILFQADLPITGRMYSRNLITKFKNVFAGEIYRKRRYQPSR